MTEAMEVPPADEWAEQGEQEPIYIDPALDRKWMESLGCRWPEPDQEEAWLAEVNALIEAGSEDLRYGANADNREEVTASRRTFYDLLPVWQQNYLKYLEKYRPRLIRPERFIDMARLLDNIGVDLSERQSVVVRVMELRPETLRNRMTHMNDLGIDGEAVVRGSLPLIALAPESINERLQPMFALARASGWADYRQQVIRIVNGCPDILGYRSDRTRLLGAVVLNAGLGTVDPEQLDHSVALRLYILPAKALVAAYLRYGSAVRTLKGLMTHADRLNSTWDERALDGLIAQHADDSAVKVYMRWNSVDDSEAAASAFRRHVRARERRRREWDERFDRNVEVLAQNLLAAAAEGESLSAERAYRQAVPEVPVLTAEQEMLLAGRVKIGRVADRSLSLRTGFEPGEREKLEEARRQGRQARNDLVRANLATVIKSTYRYRSSLRYNGTLDVADMIQAGNIGLITAAEKFDPVGEHLGQTFADYARRSILDEMRKEYIRQSRTITLPANVRFLAASIYRAAEEFVTVENREPTTPELAKLTGLAEERIGALRQAIGYPRSLDAPPYEDADTTWSDKVVDTRNLDPSQAHAHTTFGRLLADQVNALPAVYRQIVLLRFYGGASVEEVAESLGEKPDAVRRMETEALARLRRESGILIQAMMTG